MQQLFSTIEELLSEVERDKNLSGSESFIANRYPIRFVLFDNFRDSAEFVSSMQSKYSCGFKSVKEWMDNEYPDSMLTHTMLADRIIEFAASHPTQDNIITPFSELARFYDNQNRLEFDALVKTIKAIESSQLGSKNHQRIYVPIVGLEGKMSKFSSDTQIFIWYFKNADKQLNYNLILINGTLHNVNESKLSDHYTIVKDVQEWLRVWRDSNAKQNIITTSSSLFANAQYAQPDNAFTFCKCDSAYEFLVKGLNLNLSSIDYKDNELAFWDRLASEIDINNFSFEDFFNSYFQIHDLSNYSVFIKTWFRCKDEFEKWLLANYYRYKFCQKGYICQVLQRINSYIDRDFFAEIALMIFEQENPEEDRVEREICMKAAFEHGVQLTEMHQTILAEKLESLAKKTNYSTAISYFTPLTLAEKKLAIQWLASENIKRENVEEFFPELYHYLGTNVGKADPWIFDYIDRYKKAKLKNEYTASVKSVIDEKNASEVTFNSWYNNQKTTKTFLSTRQDIDVYYWIDGLGIEWIPLIKYWIDQKSTNGIYLNDVMVARSQYPTTTSNNKSSLQSISPTLMKIGDLDSHAHKSTNHYPEYILEEFEIVKSSIDDILSKYNGKKIAIVSDHGLTALSQLCDGLNMAGFSSDHNGRLATRTSGSCVTSENYVICDDKKTVSALNHQSICAKVPVHQSSHGGCTPEEILVPIFIISSHKETSNWNAILLSRELSSNPVITYKITGLSSLDVPFIIYNNKRYSLNYQEGNTYKSGPLQLDNNCSIVKLIVGDVEQQDTVVVNSGAEEDDLFI